MLPHAALAIAVLTAIIAPAPNGRRPPAAARDSKTSTTGGRRLRLLVRIDSPAAITGIRIADLIANVRTIWRPYAEIDFAGIGVEPASHDDEIRLLITEQQPVSTAGAVLGWIEFIDGRPGNTVTVSIAAARTLMTRGKWMGRAIDVQPPALRQRFITRALSRSAAHEIGHYLLRSNAHAARGLMRERMTVEEIMDDAPALNRLLPGEIASLDQRLAGALAEAEAPVSDRGEDGPAQETVKKSL